jgi:hypothetical protein
VIKLSPEVNRLLGNAALDSAFSRRVLGAERPSALHDYKLSLAEQAAILSSRARTLPELAAELCASINQPHEELPEFDVSALCQDLGIKPIPMGMLPGVIQRVIGTLPATGGNHVMRPFPAAEMAELRVA